MDKKVKKYSDEFWYNNPKVLCQTNRFIEFFPNPGLSLNEKLNALVRLAFYVSIILMVFFGNYLYLYIPIVVLAFTYFIYWNYSKNMENFEGNNENVNTEDLVIEEKECTKPTINNPFMNINLITDKRNRTPACKYYDNEKIASEVEKDFDNNLYRDVSDLYNKRNSQRQYYTMPSTTIPNEQTAFAKWLYYSPPTCKEDTIRCVPETTQPPLPSNGLESLQLQ